MGSNWQSHALEIRFITKRLRGRNPIRARGPKDALQSVRATDEVLGLLREQFFGYALAACHLELNSKGASSDVFGQELGLLRSLRGLLDPSN